MDNRKHRVRFFTLCLGLVVLVSLTGCPKPNPTENPHEGFAWAKRAGGTGSDRCYALSALPGGASVATGYFSETATFGPGEAGETQLIAGDGKDIFAAKYNADGTLALAVVAGGPSTDEAHGAHLLADGSFIITGTYLTSPVFGDGEAAETTLISPGGLDSFVARYNANGTLAYAKRAGGVNDDEGHDVAALDDGTTFVAGYFQGSAGFGVGEAGESTQVTQGSSDLFVACHDAAGLLQWVGTYGTTASDMAFGVAAFSSGSCVATGYASGTEIASHTKNVDDDEFAIKATGQKVLVVAFNSSGNRLWAKESSGSGTGTGYGICSLGDGSSLVTGSFDGSIVLGSGEATETTLAASGDTDVFIAKYASDGSLLWAKKGGGANGDLGRAIEAYADGSFVVSGYFECQATFGAGETNETVLESKGEHDVFVAKYATDGTLLWATRSGGTLSDIGFGVGALSDGSCLASGRFRGTATFGIAAGDKVSLTSPGRCDVFLAKYTD